MEFLIFWKLLFTLLMMYKNICCENIFTVVLNIHPPDPVAFVVTITAIEALKDQSILPLDIFSDCIHVFLVLIILYLVNTAVTHVSTRLSFG